MGKLCYICRRKPSKEPKVRMHKFPNDSESRVAWMKASDLTEGKYDVSSLYVCSIHFAPNCYNPGKITLKLGAVPTLSVLNSPQINEIPPSSENFMFESENKNEMSSRNKRITKTLKSKNRSSQGKNKKRKFCINQRNNSLKQTQQNAEMNYKCKICFQSFKVQSCLSEHLKVHTNESKHQCNICSRSLQSFTTLYLHMFIHSKDENYECQICYKTFPLRCYLFQHMKLHSNQKCKLCSKTCCNDHLETHSNGKNYYKCNDCPKVFTKRPLLDEHIKVHSNVRVNKCKICFRCYKFRQNLLRHLKKHSSDKSYLCNICTKSFRTNKGLKKHIMVFHNQKIMKQENDIADNISVSENYSVHTDIKLEPTNIFIPQGVNLASNDDCKISINAIVKECKTEPIESDFIEIKQEMDEDNFIDENKSGSRSMCESFIQNYKGDDGDDINIKLEIDDDYFRS